MTLHRQFPTYYLESRYASTHRFIAGVDEVGIGPLAGPVVAAAVILDPKKVGKLRTKNKWWYAVRDSKQLSEGQRGELVKIIFKNCLAFGLASASVVEIDRLNIFHAKLIAMKRAVESLRTVPSLLLVDGSVMIPGVLIKQKNVIDGDSKILSIACASILAKVTRDNICKRLHEKYPEYGFDQHKGYPTKLHHARLKRFGPCSEHRKSFAPVRVLYGQ